MLVSRKFFDSALYKGVYKDNQTIMQNMKMTTYNF
jgi:hypothetical protein